MSAAKNNKRRGTLQLILPCAYSMITTFKHRSRNIMLLMTEDEAEYSITTN